MQRTLCKRCGRLLEIGDFPFCQGDRSDHGPINRRRTLRPVVIFRNSKGEISFPGRASDQPPKGYERVELTTMAAMEKFEREQRQRSQSEHDRIAEEQAVGASAARRRLRDDLIHGFQGRDPKTGRTITYPALRHMTPLGRALAEAAMQRNDSRSGDRFDSTFHIEALHYDASNREAYRSEETGWKARRD